MATETNFAMKGPDELETRTAELRTDFAGYTDFQNEASAGHESMPMKIQYNLRRSCGRAKKQLDLLPRSTRRVRCGVCGLFKDFSPYKIHVKVQLCL